MQDCFDVQYIWESNFLSLNLRYLNNAHLIVIYSAIIIVRFLDCVKSVWYEQLRKKLQCVVCKSLGSCSESLDLIWFKQARLQPRSWRVLCWRWGFVFRVCPRLQEGTLLLFHPSLFHLMLLVFSMLNTSDGGLRVFSSDIFLYLRSIFFFV